MAMASCIEGPSRTFQASAALARHRLVKLTAGKLAYAVAADTAVLGTLNRDAFAVDEYVPVRLLTSEGTMLMVADGAIAAGVEVFQGASGKVSAAGTVKRGIALTAAAADGDTIEVLPRD